MSTDPRGDTQRILAARVRMSQYLLRHPELSSCDKCLDELATGGAEPRSWGEFSIERATGICMHCGLETTVSTARRVASMTAAWQEYPPESRMQPTEGGPQTPPAGDRDMDAAERTGLLRSKIDNLENVKIRVQRAIDALRSELRELE